MALRALQRPLRPLRVEGRKEARSSCDALNPKPYLFQSLTLKSGCSSAARCSRFRGLRIVWVHGGSAVNPSKTLSPEFTKSENPYKRRVPYCNHSITYPKTLLKIIKALSNRRAPQSGRPGVSHGTFTWRSPAVKGSEFWGFRV